MTKVRTYRIDVDENARAGDAIVISTNGCMTSQHLGTAASLDNGTCPGNVPILDVNGKLGDGMMPSSTMKKCVYDPNGKNADVYDYCNFDNTPEIPVVNDPVITFTQGGISRGSISLNQASGGNIELLAGGLDAGAGTSINCNCIDVNVDETSINVNSCNKLCVVDYDTIKQGAAAGATAVQANDLATVAMTGNYCDLTGIPSEVTTADMITGTSTTLGVVSAKGVADYVSCRVSNLYKYKGSCNCYCDLPSSGNITGDTYNVRCAYGDYPAGTNYSWNGTDWDPLGGSIDLSGYAECCDIPTDNCQLSNSCGYTTCTGTVVASDLNPYAKSCTLCVVATSGKYCDLIGTPTIPAELTSGCATTISSNKINVNYDGTTIKKNSCNCLYADFTGLATTSELACKADISSLCTVATSGCYCDLTDVPTLCTVATSGKYCDLSGTPSLCAVATSGEYCDLTGSPSLCTVATSGKYCDLSGTPSLCTVATSGCYCDLTGTPTIPTVNTKAFTLSSTSDTTNASAAAAYINGGDNAIVILSGVAYNLASKSSSSMVFKGPVSTTANTSDTTISQATLTFTVSGSTVSAISNTSTSLGKYLETDRNYSTPLTPSYNGSPATKKYVDDCVGGINSAEWGNITGTMACQTDLQGALNCKADCIAIPTDNCQLANSCGYTTCTGTLVSSDLDCYAQCCDFISKTNTTAFTPTGDYNPATKLYVDTAVAGAGGGDMCYCDFNFVSKSGASVTLDLSSEITPSANFTVNKPSTIKEGQSYVLRVTNGATPYTMSLGTCVTNPWGVDLTLTPSGTDQFVFYASSSSELELQKDYDDENIFVTQAAYDALPSTKLTDGKTYFIYEE